MASHDDQISSFVDMTGASAEKATEYLTGSSWDLENAVLAYFADQDEAPTTSEDVPEPEPEYTGPRTLDGRPAPEYAGAKSSSSKKPQKRTGLATLSSLGGHNHDDDDDDEDDDEDDERRGPRDLFAGGEKSGLAVQDPNQRSNDPRKLVDDIVAKAKANSKATRNTEEPAAGPSRSSLFRGSGQTLGGDGVESRTIPDPRGNAIPTSANDTPAQERFLHIWEDGFSIDDGELRRFDDPENRAALEMIRQGRAPVHLMNVRYDQRVDVKLQQHNEPYRPQPKIYRPFGGEGRRLGSPVPGVGSVAAPPAATSTTAAPQAASGSSQGPSSGVDESQPTLMLRIQLPDGTRLPARFNTTQTVGDVYEFVQQASPVTSSRPWVLSTTFPNKDHTEKDLVLGEQNEFKRGGTVVVKWA